MNELRKNFFITLGSLGLILLVLGGIFAYLLYYQILPLRERLLEVLVAINIAEHRKDYFINIVQNDIEEGKADIESIRSHFFAYTDRSAKEFIVFLESAALRNNLALTISTLPSGEAALTVVSVDGGYSNIMTFLRQLENEKYLFHIDSVALREQGEVLGATIQFSLAKP